jgi:hypothetical protein
MCPSCTSPISPLGAGPDPGPRLRHRGASSTGPQVPAPVPGSRCQAAPPHRPPAAFTTSRARGPAPRTSALHRAAGSVRGRFRPRPAHPPQGASGTGPEVWEDWDTNCLGAFRRLRELTALEPLTRMARTGFDSDGPCAQGTDCTGRPGEPSAHERGVTVLTARGLTSCACDRGKPMARRRSNVLRTRR